ncbi:Uncharacterised protein [uncultured archaeon]|nr:Uncharacterised protein [uncultured archaeon]
MKTIEPRKVLEEKPKEVTYLKSQIELYLKKHKKYPEPNQAFHRTMGEEYLTKIPKKIALLTKTTRRGLSKIMLQIAIDARTTLEKHPQHFTPEEKEIIRRLIADHEEIGKKLQTGQSFKKK